MIAILLYDEQLVRTQFLMQHWPDNTKGDAMQLPVK